jgi:hypothetical protein
MEGIICGKRRIDLDGIFDGSEGYYEFNNSETVYLVAMDMRGFHRVPEIFIIEKISNCSIHETKEE